MAPSAITTDFSHKVRVFKINQIHEDYNYNSFY